MYAAAAFCPTPEDLIVEHFHGRRRGLLDAALGFLAGRSAPDFGGDEEFEETCADAGIADLELAAARMVQNGDYVLPSDPRGPRRGMK